MRHRGGARRSLLVGCSERPCRRRVERALTWLLRPALTGRKATAIVVGTMKQQNVHAIVVGIIALTVAPAIWAQDNSRYDIEELKRGQREIKRQLQEIKRQQEEIKTLLQARPAAPSGPNVEDRIFDIGDNPVKGASTAKLTLVEFTDYQ